ncbi:hypothetical protein MAHJHV65_46720 [Mycobacterium avium subsp. hominissuis]
MDTLTIAPCANGHVLVTQHCDRATARAALAAYVTATDTDPHFNQITAAHESYEFVSLADHSVTAIATIEPSLLAAL